MNTQKLFIEQYRDEIINEFNNPDTPTERRKELALIINKYNLQGMEQRLINENNTKEKDTKKW